MKQTRSRVARAALAASLSIAAASAHAVPIVFDFTGTVTNSFVFEDGFVTSSGALDGQDVSGRITVELDGLEQFSRSDARGQTLGLGDRNSDALVLISSELIIGGVNRNVNGYPQVGGQIEAFDAAACGTGCPTSNDYVRVLSSSSALDPTLPLPATYEHRMLYLDWADPTNVLGLVDLSSGFDPLALLPVISNLLPIGRFSESTFGCNATCDSRPLRQEGGVFSIDSLTVSTANVPEPGTLALFSVGLLGTALARRARRC